jgi:hypothetical protein
MVSVRDWGRVESTLTFPFLGQGLSLGTREIIKTTLAKWEIRY